MNKILRIRTRFLEPYRLIDWVDRTRRKKDPRFLRGQGFANWHKSTDGDGRPYITGTLLRSAVMRAAEELLFIKQGVWGGNPCCNLEFDQVKNGKQTSFLRRRPTLTWPSEKAPCNLSDLDSVCPYCALVSLDRSKGIHFGNLNLTGNPRFNTIDEMAAERVLNRVDFHSGKAHDYFKVYEVDNEEFGIYTADITLFCPNGDSLLRDALAFVDKVCGALCRIDVVEPTHEAEKRDNQKSERESSETIKSAAKEIVEGLKGQRKIQVARILADAVRELRGKGADTIRSLPSGKTNKGHALWDIKINGRKLREVLGSLHTGGNWRVFCESLGEELYRQYNECKGNDTSRFRVLGETEYHSKQSRSALSVPSSPSRSGNAYKEWIISGRFKAETSFHFGKENQEGQQTSLSTSLDAKGHYRIPRSVLRGALRRDLRVVFGSGCNMERLGGAVPCVCPVCLVMRRITVLDSRCHDHSEPPEIRQRIRLNPHTSVVDEGALFDIEIGPEFISFPFVLRYRGLIGEETLPEKLSSVLQYWTDEKAWLGGEVSAGKGRFSLNIQNMFEWSLQNDQGLRTYIEKKGYRGEEFDLTEDEIIGLKKITLPDMSETASHKGRLAPQWTKAEWTISFASPLLSADPIAALFDPDDHDSISYKKRRWNETEKKMEEIYALKAETVRGLVRTAVGKRTGDLEKNHEDCSCALCTIFGNEHEASKIRFEDLIPEPEISQPATKHIDRVAIDRFTGGAVDRKKFDALPLAGSPGAPLKFKGIFWMRRDLSEKDRSDIAAALRDIRNGFYPVGGKTGVGYGWVSGLEVTPSFSELILPGDDGKRKESITPKKEEALNPSPPAASLPPEDQEKRYHPHYFLKPNETVHRKCEQIGHEKLRADLYTGKIFCRLETLSPFFIPDTAERDAFQLAKETDGHKSYRFFRINGEIMIPGSELRGMVSSVYEGVSNSCFRIFEGGRYLSRRMAANEEGIKPGRVLKDGCSVEWMGEMRLPLYDNLRATQKIKFAVYKTGDTDKDRKLKAAISTNEIIAGAAEANRTFLLNLHPEEKERILLGRQKVAFRSRPTGNPQDKVALLGSSGEEGYIRWTGSNMVNIQRTEKEDQNYNPAWDPISLNILLDTDPEDPKKRLRNSLKKPYPRPLLWFIKDQLEYTIPKRCERIFFSLNQTQTYPIPKTVRDQYRDIVKDYKQNFDHIDEKFMTTITNGELREGDLIYFRLDYEGKEVAAIMPVRISRITDPLPLHLRLPSPALAPCTREEEDDDFFQDIPKAIKRLFFIHPDGLCPACRLFGTPGYAGRVRFGFAKHHEKPNWLNPGKDDNKGEPLTLPLLEMPRPTWSMPEKGSTVPGRKFYVHHSGWQILKKEQASIKKTKNNCSVEPLNSGNTFSFEVFFENLEEWELGLLLYCLEFEEGNNLAHKLGMAKAMGFGSVKINADEIYIRNSDGGLANETERKTEWRKEAFLQLKSWFKEEWYQISHIRDLRNLLKFPDDNQDRTVCYPELEEKELPGYIELKKAWPIQERLRSLTTPWSVWFPYKKSEGSQDEEVTGEAAGVSTEQDSQKPSEIKNQGVVKWFNLQKRYGFIIEESGQEIFFHITSVRDSSKMKQGRKVEFVIREGKKGPQACEVEFAE